MTYSRRTLWIFIITIALIILSYNFIDKPVVYFAYNHDLRQYGIFNAFTLIVNAVQLLTALAYGWIAYRYVAKRISANDQKILLIANSIAAAYIVKDALKFIFGRYWPATWTNNNPSLLSNHAYGFYWFHGGNTYGSFPSGHTTVMLAATTAIALSFPKARVLTSLMILASFLVAIGLIGCYYHYVSDIIAGGLLGYWTSYLLIRLGAKNT